MKFPKLKNPKSKLVVVNFLLLLCLLLVVGWIFFGKPQVLKNWRISVDSTKTYYPLSTLDFKSTAVKQIDAQGSQPAHRYLTCEPTKDFPYQEVELPSYPLNRKPGARYDTPFSIDLPRPEKFEGLPRDCNLNIDACYKPYFNFTKDTCFHAESGKFRIDNIPENSVQTQPVPQDTSTVGQTPLNKVFIPPNPPTQVIITQESNEGTNTDDGVSNQPQPIRCTLVPYIPFVSDIIINPVLRC